MWVMMERDADVLPGCVPGAGRADSSRGLKIACTLPQPVERGIHRSAMSGFGQKRAKLPPKAAQNTTLSFFGRQITSSEVSIWGKINGASKGHAETRNSFMSPSQLQLFRILSESALGAGLTNRNWFQSTPMQGIVYAFASGLSPVRIRPRSSRSHTPTCSIHV